MDFKRPKLVEIYSHRGFAGLHPENTLLGYQESLNLDVDSLDIDVAITKDNIIVASHDRYLNKDFTRDSNKNWLENNNLEISNFNYEDLKNYDVGRSNPQSLYFQSFPNQVGADNVIIPSLQNIIEFILEHSKAGKKLPKIQIEIKTSPIADSNKQVEKFVNAIIKVLADTNFIHQAELQSFDWRTLIYAKKILPAIKVAYITEQTKVFDSFKAKWTAGYQLEDYNNSVPFIIAKVGGDIWCPYYKDLTEELITEAHLYNIKVIPWTVDTEIEMQQLINWGVDGIITNYPNILRQRLTLT